MTWTNQREVCMAIGVLLFMVICNYLLYLLARKRPKLSESKIAGLSYDLAALKACNKLKSEFGERVLRYAAEYAESTGRSFVDVTDIEWVREHYLDDWGNHINCAQAPEVE